MNLRSFCLFPCAWSHPHHVTATAPPNHNGVHDIQQYTCQLNNMDTLHSPALHNTPCTATLPAPLPPDPATGPIQLSTAMSTDAPNISANNYTNNNHTNAPTTHFPWLANSQQHLQFPPYIPLTLVILLYRITSCSHEKP